MFGNIANDVKRRYGILTGVRKSEWKRSERAVL